MQTEIPRCEVLSQRFAVSEIGLTQILFGQMIELSCQVGTFLFTGLYCISITGVNHKLIMDL